MEQAKEFETERRMPSAEEQISEDNTNVENELGEETQYKALNDCNLKALADDLGELLAQHVGGPFNVTLAKVEHTHLGQLDDRLLLNFVVEDKVWILRRRAKGDPLF